MLSRRKLLVGGAAIAVTGGIGLVVWSLPGEGGEEGRPEVRLGRDVCDRCGMVIADGRFAAAARLPNGKAWRFDDIGCLLNKLLPYERREEVRAWVASYPDERWLEAATAWYVAASSLRTPMAFGVVALATRAEAETEAAEVDGRVLSWSELRAEWIPGEGLPGLEAARAVSERGWF